NLWIHLFEEEIDFLEQEINRYRSSNKSRKDEKRGKLN
ncbi:unnamed protein product, partial [marine sediment metagenome]